jgi:hypothetical protein
MKLYLTCFFIAILLPISISYAIELTIKEEIPEKYILYNALVSNDEVIDKKTFEKEFKQKCKESEVKQCQLVVYNSNKIIVAFGEQRKDKKAQVCPFDLVDEKQKIKILTDFWEDLFHYETSPQEIFQMYDDNEVVADEDLKGKKIILKDVKIKEIAKDAFGQPYISVSVDRHGFNTVMIKLDTKDPFLRKIKKGARVFVVATPEKFVMHNVLMKGKIIMFDKYMLFDGKVIDKGK